MRIGTRIPRMSRSGKTTSAGLLDLRHDPRQLEDLFRARSCGEFAVVAACGGALRAPVRSPVPFSFLGVHGQNGTPASGHRVVRLLSEPSGSGATFEAWS